MERGGRACRGVNGELRGEPGGKSRMDMARIHAAGAHHHLAMPGAGGLPWRANSLFYWIWGNDARARQDLP